MNQTEADEIVFPLAPSQKMAVRRNIERLIADAVGPQEVNKCQKKSW